LLCAFMAEQERGTCEKTVHVGKRKSGIKWNECVNEIGKHKAQQSKVDRLFVHLTQTKKHICNRKFLHFSFQTFVYVCAPSETMMNFTQMFWVFFLLHVQ
jgi:hypothetical protein